jgi:acyl-CoA reductase-like NAD-dependent aldehyde dehydrogenase
MVAVASAAKTEPLLPNLPSHRDPYYAGRWQKPKSPRYVDSISPGTGEPLGKVIDGSAADADEHLVDLANPAGDVERHRTEAGDRAHRHF